MESSENLIGRVFVEGAIRALYSALGVLLYCRFIAHGCVPESAVVRAPIAQVDKRTDLRGKDSAGVFNCLCIRLFV